MVLKTTTEDVMRSGWQRWDISLQECNNINKYTPIWAEEYLYDELKKNRLIELIDTYDTLYSSKEPMEWDTYKSKTNDGFREENVTSNPNKQVKIK